MCHIIGVLGEQVMQQADMRVTGQAVLLQNQADALLQGRQTVI
jgi:hypothetical protein